MNVLIVEPGQYPREAEISGDLKSMQEIVGGRIDEISPWDDNTLIICNNEYFLLGLPLNRRISDDLVIGGTFFVCRCTEEGGKPTFASLTPEQMLQYNEKLRMPELFFKTPDGLTVKPCEPALYRLFMGDSTARVRKGTSLER